MAGVVLIALEDYKYMCEKDLPSILRQIIAAPSHEHDKAYIEIHRAGVIREIQRDIAAYKNVKEELLDTIHAMQKQDPSIYYISEFAQNIYESHGPDWREYVFEGLSVSLDLICNQ